MRRVISVAPIAILLPHLHHGGAERVCVNLANEFIRRGFAVDIVLMSATGELREALDPFVRLIDLKASRVRGVIKPLVAYLRQAKPSGLLANMWPLTVAALISKGLSGIQVRTVLAEHTSWSIDALAKRLVSRLSIKTTMYLSYPQADAVVAVSRGAAEDLAKFSGIPLDSVRVIFNPIAASSAPTPSAPFEPRDWVVGGHKRILGVGTLKPVKDYPTMLRAFAQLRHRMDARLLVLGEGVERPSLQALVTELGIAQDVFMHGFVRDTTPYFAHADLHVLSSSGEGFGNVLVEALDQGTPVVSTDCKSGPREILFDGKYGTLVPVGDVEALAKAMEDALTRDHDHEALKCRAQDFSVDKAADEYLDLLIPGWRELVA